MGLAGMEDFTPLGGVAPVQYSLYPMQPRRPRLTLRVFVKGSVATAALLAAVIAGWLLHGYEEARASTPGHALMSMAAPSFGATEPLESPIVLHSSLLGTSGEPPAGAVSAERGCEEAGTSSRLEPVVVTPKPRPPRLAAARPGPARSAPAAVKPASASAPAAAAPASQRELSDAELQKILDGE